MRWEIFAPLADNWWEEQGEGELVWDGTDWAALEHLIHEVGHAIHLGIDPVLPDLQARVGDTLRYASLSHRSRQEELTLVTELFVCQELGIPICRADVNDMAAIQEVYPVNFNDPSCPSATKLVLEAIPKVLQSWIGPHEQLVLPGVSIYY